MAACTYPQFRSYVDKLSTNGEAIHTNGAYTVRPERRRRVNGCNTGKRFRVLYRAVHASTGSARTGRHFARAGHTPFALSGVEG